MPATLRDAIRLIASESGVPRLLALAGVARLHVGGLGLAVLLLIEEVSGSVATAGVATGLLSLGVGLTRPLQGRLIDRFGVRTLGVCAAFHGAFVTALLVADMDAANAVAPLVLIFGLGFSTPAISVATRAIWSAHVRGRAQPAVFGVDTAFQDVAFVVGPLAAGLIAGTAGAPVALATLVVVGCIGACAIVLAAPPRAASERPSNPRGLRALAPALVASAGFGLIYGAIGVAGVAWVLEDGQPGLAGPIFAVIFAGGLIGDLLLAPRRADLPIKTRLRTRLLALLAATSLLLAAPGVALLAIAVAVTGALLANASVTLLLDIAARMPEGARAEAFGWAGATLRLGNAAGAAGAGLLVEAAGPRPALLLAALGALFALTALLGGRSAPGKTSLPSAWMGRPGTRTASPSD